MKRQSMRTRANLRSYISYIEQLEDRYALSAWSTFGGNPQHTSISSVGAQPLEAIHWEALVDPFMTSRAAHYGGPLITNANTVIYPYKTSHVVNQGDDPNVKIVARSGIDGSLMWQEDSDWIPTAFGWFPQLQPVYAQATDRVYFAEGNGNIAYKGNVDVASGGSSKVVVNVFSAGSGNRVTTGLTCDSVGNIYYGYRNDSGVGGIVKVTPAGVATIMSANTASQNGTNTDWIPQMNGTPALNNDESILYITLRRNGSSTTSRLVGLSTTNLSTIYNSGALKDPRNNWANNASITNDSTASPMVAPDGDVFLGVMGNPYNGSRGWMLHFNADLTMLNTTTPDPTDLYVPGGFGWDTTASIVPVSMVPDYTGPSQYLLFTKYNNYYIPGHPTSGDGANAIAVIDPLDSELDLTHDDGTQPIMKKIRYKVGPTPDWDYPSVPTAVREWCINYGAVDVAAQDVIVNCADGFFYKWHLPTNTLTNAIELTDGIGQPYTMTTIGVDGTVYGIQWGKLFAMGQTPQMSIGDATLSEGTGGSTIATFTVSLNYTRTTNITVNYTTNNGTAIAGSDFTATSGSLTFLPGERTKQISVTVNPESMYEADETFTVDLSAVGNAVLVDGQALGTIVNDDAQPTLLISDVSQNELNSGSSSFVFTVTQSAVSGLTTTVNFATAHDTADGFDYTSTSGALSFTPGQTSKTITVFVTGDTTFEGGDTFFVNLSGNINASILDGQGLGTIINDDNVPSLTIGDVSVTEGGLATFFVTLSNPSAQTVTVNWATANNTAVSPADYQGGNDTLTFTPGQTSRSFSITTVNDSLDEVNPETYFVNLTNPNNAFISDSQAIGSLQDNDPAPSISISDVSANEGQAGTTAFNFVVTLSAASGRQVRVNYATAHDTTLPDDYQTTSGLLTFNPGEISKPVTVLVNGDGTNEANDTFFVNLSNAIASTIADGQGLGTIVDDDGLSISIGDISQSEGNSGTTSFTFNVTLSASSASTVTVEWDTANGTASIADNDYTNGSGTVTFLPGQTSRPVTVTINGDAKNEADETFFVDLSNASNAAINDAQAQGTIVNDDALPSLSSPDFSVPEMDYNTGTVNVFVYLSAESGQTVSVFYETSNGTASSTSANKDYIDTSGTLTFAPGETVKSFEVAIVGDIRDEFDETIRVLLSSPDNATIADDEAIITITDDDITYVYMDDPVVTEGNSGTTTATVTVDLSIAADYDITVDYTTENVTAVAGSDYTTKSGQLFFAAGVTSLTVPIDVLGDLLDESNERFNLRLTGATPGVVIGAYPVAHIDITDDDTTGFVINDVAIAEGNSGTTTATFTVSLTLESDHEVGVSAATANGSATAGSDYVANSGVLSFGVGVMTQSFTVTINGDTDPEVNDTYFVNLTSPTGGAVISDSQGLGTIINDDSVTISINDVTKTELHTGVHGYTFIASLSAPSAQTVTVQFATADGTATVANIDYFANSGSVTFIPGQTTKVITVQAKGDKRIELDEDFFVNLSNATNATIADPQGVGIILNDDGPVIVGGAIMSPPNSAPAALTSPSRTAMIPPRFDTTLIGSQSSGSTVDEASTTIEDAFAALRFYVLDESRLTLVDGKTGSPESNLAKVPSTIGN